MLTAQLAKLALADGRPDGPKRLKLKKSEINAFSEEYAKRIRAMCHHLNQSLRKHVGWAMQLVGATAEDADDQDDGDEEEEEEPADEHE
eukprot:749705-Pyramimonas_sp.AAC.1